MKIAYLHPWGIGDYLLVSNQINYLKNTYSAEIIVITNNNNVTNFIENFYGFETINLQNSILLIIKKIFNHKFDLLIPSFGISPFKYYLFSFFIRHKNKISLHDYKKSLIENNKLHRIDANFNLLKLLFPSLNLKRDYFFPKQDFSNTQIYDLLFHFGSDKKQGYKRWPIENWISLIISLKENKKILIIIGPEEEQFVDILKKIGIDYIYAPTFNDLCKFILSSKLVVCNDSGIGHLSSSLNVKTFSIFGPSDPEIFRPIKKNTYVISNKFTCMPCIKKGGDFGCDYSFCLRSITVSDIRNKLL